MSPQTLIQTALDAGVRIRINGENLRLRGDGDAIQRIAPILKPHKKEIIDFLQNTSISAQVREFMDVDGMTLDEAQAWESQSIVTMEANEWIEIIQQLDAAINLYCTTKQVSPQARVGMLAARMNQSLASIPETLAWFLNQLKEKQT